MAYTWAKVYIEILDDHKMGLLPDSLWRRGIELILLAKKLDQDGWLPGLMEMSWTLRMPAEKLEADLAELSKTSIVELKDGNWFLTNFAKRQAAEPVDTRVRNFRKRNQQETCNEDVTTCYIDKTKTRLDQDKESSGASAPSPRKRDELFDAICAVCCIDPKVKGNGAKIGKARAALSESEPPYTAAEVNAFGAWWNSDAWRAEKGPPTVWKLTEQIGIVRNGNGKGKSNGQHSEHGSGRATTPEQETNKRRVQAAIDKRDAERRAETERRS
jgi:hypothetical protein